MNVNSSQVVCCVHRPPPIPLSSIIASIDCAHKHNGVRLGARPKHGFMGCFHQSVLYRPHTRFPYYMIFEQGMTQTLFLTSFIHDCVSLNAAPRLSCLCSYLTSFIRLVTTVFNNITRCPKSTNLLHLTSESWATGEYASLLPVFISVALPTVGCVPCTKSRCQVQSRSHLRQTRASNAFDCGS
jgi:hypothetical protein